MNWGTINFLIIIQIFILCNYKKKLKRKFNCKLFNCFYILLGYLLHTSNSKLNRQIILDTIKT